MRELISKRRQGETTKVQALTKRVSEYRRILRSHQTARFPNPRRIAAADKNLADRIELLASAKADEKVNGPKSWDDESCEN